MINTLQYEPIYLQLRELIRNDIEEGIYSPGTSIPSENKLAEHYNVTRTTIRNAILSLVQEGLLKKIKGKGVFVLGKKAEQKIGFNDGFSLISEKKEYVKKFIEKDTYLRKAGPLFAEIFRISPFEKILFLESHLKINGQTNLIQDFYIPEKILPELKDIERSAFQQEDIFSFYNIKFYGLKQNIKIVYGPKKIRKKLSIPDDLHILQMESFYKDKFGIDILYIKQYIRSDLTYLSIDL